MSDIKLDQVTKRFPDGTEAVKEMAAMNLEIENLLDCKARLEKLLYDTQRPLAISEECMLQREKRTGIDQTFDEPEKGLSKVFGD